MKIAAWTPALLFALVPPHATATSAIDVGSTQEGTVATADAAGGADVAERDANNEPARDMQDHGQAKQACERRERAKGHGNTGSKVVCALKVTFQSRILRNRGGEPVEMTVGSPPMVTDDTDTPGARTWEVNIVVDGASGGRERRSDAPLLDVNYGIGERLQVAYEVPYIVARSERPAPGGSMPMRAQGVGDSTVGLKYRFYDDEQAGLSFAFYPQLGFRTPDAPRSVSEGSTKIILPLLATKEFEHASVSANIGVEAASDEHRWFGSFGLGRRLTDRVALLTEVAGTDLNAPRERRVLFNLGLRAKIGTKQAIMGSIGHDLHAGTDQHEQVYFSLAFQQLFGD